MGNDRRTPPGAGELRWYTSTHSQPDSGSCLEAAWMRDTLLLRDSRCRQGPVLRIDAAAWQAFLDGVRRDEFG